MKVQVRYFAALREALGSGEACELPEGQSLGQLRDALIARGGAHAQVLGRGRPVRCAVNQAMADDAAVLPAGAEVAFFPPVTGG